MFDLSRDSVARGRGERKGGRCVSADPLEFDVREKEREREREESLVPAL